MEGALVGRPLADEGDRDAFLAAQFEGGGSPHRRTHSLRDDAGTGEIDPRVEQMHMPAAPTGKARLLAEDLRRHRIEIDPLGDGDVMRPVRRRHEICGIEMRTDADRARLLPVGKMHLPRYGPVGHVEDRRLPLEIGRGDALLEGAAFHHGLVHPQKLRPGRCHGILPHADDEAQAANACLACASAKNFQSSIIRIDLSGLTKATGPWFENHSTVSSTNSVRS